MNTHNICFHGEIRKIFFKSPLLSRAKVVYYIDISLYVAEEQC